MYAIRFENLYYDKIWGGKDFKKFRCNVPKENIGESWDVACHKNGMSIVDNGELKGKSFKEIIEEYGEKLLGTEINKEKFPLLIKLINSNSNLSVQVHPNDEYANKYEGEYGKTEAWYVIDAKPGAELIVGTKNCTKKEFEKAIEEGTTEKYLNNIKVKKGDCYLINSGLVHAIGEGLIIAEIQQNSDVTYRVYDYNRGRELHVNKALDVIDFDLKAINCSTNSIEELDGYSKILLCDNKYFRMEKYNIYINFIDISNEKMFYVITCVDGEGKIKCNNRMDNIKKGDSYLIPATLGEYSITGQVEIIKTYAK
ncbi:class I mannose-6-phosphate isomerase [Clostridium niameyense]|uniref:Phosphohexomutase n=1 Tax=Clostridium niameyense TaxID=1622073 RepID=A0A6M0R8G6_9CLOT|nr:type I phosphomannose isomerase catalytic subunit [Clostridium niameyense]NEZ46535.1 class I mannose-6-phosphate isomerase [Clostridium niameyense]